jgi:E3 ubiquitin-protein ligase MARCH6
MMTVPNAEKSPSGSSFFSKFETTFPSLVNKAEPYFAMLGRAVRVRTARTQDIWVRFALGEGPSEKVFAVVLGYAVVGLLLALYLNILTVGNAKSAGRAVRNAVRQQLLVLKVATFIFIELVTFPLACGVVLDLCTVWLFPEANLHSRAAFFFQAPLTAMFYHWVAGTLFMYVDSDHLFSEAHFMIGTHLLFCSLAVAPSCALERCGS